MKKTLGALLLISGATVAVASPQNSNIQLGSISVNPQSSNSISLKALQPDAAYDVTCQIYPVLGTSWENVAVLLGYASVSINPNFQYQGTAINGNSFTEGYIPQFTKPNYPTYKAIGVVGSSSSLPGTASLTFRNLDDTYTINVDNCVATIHPYLAKTK